MTYARCMNKPHREVMQLSLAKPGDVYRELGSQRCHRVESVTHERGWVTVMHDDGTPVTKPSGYKVSYDYIAPWTPATDDEFAGL